MHDLAVAHYGPPRTHSRDDGGVRPRLGSGDSSVDESIHRACRLTAVARIWGEKLRCRVHIAAVECLPLIPNQRSVGFHLAHFASDRLKPTLRDSFLQA